MKTVLITGASSGFGYELTEQLLKRGWRVIACLRQLEARRHLFADLDRVYSHHLELVDLDLEKSDQFSKVMQVFQERRIELDCLVNNAGFGVFGALEDLSEAQLRKQFEVNFFGLFLLTQKLLPSLRKTKGRIINLSSTLGFTGMPFAGAYAASKFAVEGMSECLALDLAPHGVQVCLVEPGAFKTKFGSNMLWGERSFDQSSPYSERALAFKEYREKNRKSPNSKVVVDLLVQLCEAPKIPLRAPIGKDAKTAHFARKILSQAQYHSLLKTVFGKLSAK